MSLEEATKQIEHLKLQEALAALRPLAEEAGVTIPALAQFQGKVDIDQPDTEVARTLGSLCSRQPIFRQGEGLVAVNDEGEMVPMNSKRFGGWCEKFVTTCRWTREKGEHAASMLDAQAARILVNDAFLVKVRRLDFYFPVRLPVLRPGGELELLEPGYDAQTRSWTEETVAYPDDWCLDRAVEWLDRALGEWPWADLVGEPEPALAKSRNSAVVLAGMLGTYCRAFFSRGDRRPMVIVSGSGVGTGKSTLCKMQMCPVYGLPPELDLPNSEDKFGRLLESVALSYEPFLFLDDVGKRLKSHTLNKFVTASVHSGTTLYAQRTFKVPNVTQVFCSGIDLEFDDNIERRAMVCELFLPGEVQGRTFKYEVTDGLLGSAEFRSDALAAMWAIVKEWHGRRGAGILEDRKVLKSFENFSRLVCSMTQVVGWRDPLDKPEMISGGDTESRDLKRLAVGIADAQPSTSHTYTVMDIVGHARRMALLDHMVGIEQDGDLGRIERQRFGKRLSGAVRGQIMQRTDGSWFEFGSRKGESGTLYTCRLATNAEELL